MEVSVENTSALRRRVQVKVPIDEVETRLKSRVSELAQGARIDGFRKGKVPTQLIVQRYGKQLQDEIYRKLLDETLDQSLRQEQLQPVALFDLDFTRPERGQDFEYQVSAEVLGELKLTGLEELNVEKPIFSVEPSVVEDMLRSYQIHSTDWKEVDGKPQDGDRVGLFIKKLDEDNDALGGDTAATVDTTESTDSSPTAESESPDNDTDSAETPTDPEYPNVFLIVGEPKSWEDERIESVVRTMECGDSTEIREHEAKNTSEEIADEANSEAKKLDINVKLLRIERGDRPSIEELIEKNELPGESEEEVRDNIHNSEVERLEAQSRALCLQQLEKSLVEHSGIVLPKYSYRSEVLAMRRNLYQLLKQRRGTQDYDHDHEDIEDVPEDQLPELEEDRLNRIKMTMAVNFLGAKLVDKYQCKVESTELQNSVQQQLSSYGQNLTKEIVDQIYDEQNISQLRNGLLLRKAWDAALEDVNLEDVPSSSDDLESLRSKYSEIAFDVPVDDVEEDSANDEDDSESELESGSGKGFLRSIVDRFKRNT